MNGVSHPQFVIFNQREYFLVGDGIDISNNQELLAVLNELCNELPEQRERWVGYYNVCLF